MWLDKDNFIKIKDKINNIVQGQELDLIDFKIFPERQVWVIRSLVDHPHGGVTVEECSLLNHKISVFLEEDGILSGNFVVEVNSPGLDRPLKEPKDFLRVKGKVVRLWLKELLNNKRCLEAEVSGVNDDSLFLKTEGDIIKVGFGIIDSAKQKI